MFDYLEEFIIVQALVLITQSMDKVNCLSLTYADQRVLIKVLIHKVIQDYLIQLNWLDFDSI